MSRLRLIADDLTGALDSSCAFANPGKPVQVAVPGQPLPTGDRLAISTESRTMDRLRAEAAVTTATLAFAGADTDTLWFKKIDSVMRGHPFAETRAAIKAGAFSRCVFAPAYPDMARITRNGRQYSMDETGGAVPVGPDFREAFGQLHVPLLIIDAERQETLCEQVACLGQTLRGPTLWVGSGGLAHALGEAGTLVPFPPLRGAIVGTRHSVTRTQVESALADGTVTDRLPADGAAWLLAPSFTAASAAETHALLRRHLLEIVVPDAEATSLLVTGGDTLSTVLDITGAGVLDCIGETVNGVPVSRIRGGRWHGVTLLSKSGGFGDTALLSRLAAQARQMP